MTYIHLHPLRASSLRSPEYLPRLLLPGTVRSVAIQRNLDTVSDHAGGTIHCDGLGGQPASMRRRKQTYIYHSDDTR